MTPIDPRRLATAFVDARTPTLADVLAFVASEPDLTPTRRRDLASGLRRVAKAIGWAVGDTPTDPIWLRTRIARVVPADIGMSPKSWANAVSDARAALAAFGIVERRRAPSTPLTEDWQDLWQGLLTLDDRSLTIGLGRLVRFLSRIGVDPADVSGVHADWFREAVEMNELRKNPAEALRAATFAWNRAIGRVPGWPAQSLTVPRSDYTYVIPLPCYPPSFAEDLERYAQSLAHPDPLDPDARTAPMRPASVANRRGLAHRFASALVHAGVEPGQIRDLATLVQPDTARRGLTWLLERKGNETSQGIGDQAIALAQLARRYVRVSKTVQDELDGFALRLLPARAPGLTDKNRERLRPLEDPATLRALLLLPERLAERAKMMDGVAAAREMEVAVAVAILIAAPIRRKNLVELHLNRNLRRLRGGKAVLVYDASEVKNRRSLEIELPKETVALIDRHLKIYRPHLVPGGTDWLFPRRDGQASIEPGLLAKRVCATIRRDLGLEINLHLFRHIAALTWLRAKPGHYEVARRLLGHAELSSTLNAYAGHEAGTATRLFAEVVDAARRGDAR